MTDPKLASYGSSQLPGGDHAARADDAAQRHRPDGARQHVRGARPHQRPVVAALDQAAANWGVKVLRYEIKDLTPPKEILHAMQAQITAEREKRAVIATSEGKQQEQINLANGAREAAIAKSEGEKQAEINNAQGQAAATARDRRGQREGDPPGRGGDRVAPGGLQAVNLKVAEQYVARSPTREDQQHADRAVERLGDLRD